MKRVFAVTGQQDWVPQGVDTSVPSMARVYDFMLGGGHNFAVDRGVGAQIEVAMPGLRQAARVNRAFLGRVVRFMAGQGVRQFLDIGSGIPTVGNVHQIAQREDPECHVVYVDRDPVAVAHSELMLMANDRAAVVQADMRDPESILGSPEVRRLLNFDEPVGLLMLLVLHWVPDEADLLNLLDRYQRPLAAGSYLAITHVTGDNQGEGLGQATEAIERSKSPDQVNLRTHAEICKMFGDFELIEPGLVGCALWRPGGPGDISDSPDMNMLVYGGVGRKNH
jgi:hypothetical protein